MYGPVCGASIGDSVMPFARLLYRIGYPLAVLMLAAWAYVTFLGPGWGTMHLFLILGMVLLYWRIVRGDAPPE
jgi:hypothetical protein